jgi:2-polyprenyl-3-methyl-5-hydroxy-6-metoxy-1,4-benzoquinol methylase
MGRNFTDTSIERVRDYWNRRPCNVRHSQASPGTRTYFDQVEERKYLVEPHILRFAQFGRWDGKRVLEIGCGIGTDTINFARAGASVTAVDLSVNSLDLARKRAEIYGLTDRIEFIEADAERLSQFVQPAAYDLVYSFGVIHHSPRPEQILREIRSHFSGPDTVLKVMVYHWRSWKVGTILMSEAGGRWWRLREAVATHSEAQSGCPVTHCYTRQAGRLLLENAGFDVADMRVEHIFPYVVDEYVKYRYVRARPFTWMPSSLFSALERRLGWHLCLTAHPAVLASGS